VEKGSWFGELEPQQLAGPEVKSARADASVETSTLLKNPIQPPTTDPERQMIEPDAYL
jgi:hypothetical protein